MKRFLLIFVVAVGGCQSSTVQRPVAPVPVVSSGERVWLRLDGQRASSSPTLLAKFNADKAACIGDATIVSDTAEACMRQKRYTYVAASEAPQIAASLAARRSAQR